MNTEERYMLSKLKFAYSGNEEITLLMKSEWTTNIYDFDAEDCQNKHKITNNYVLQIFSIVNSAI